MERFNLLFLFIHELDHQQRARTHTHTYLYVYAKTHPPTYMYTSKRKVTQMSKKHTHVEQDVHRNVSHTTLDSCWVWHMEKSYTLKFTSRFWLQHTHPSDAITQQCIKMSDLCFLWSHLPDLNPIFVLVIQSASASDCNLTQFNSLLNEKL